MVQPLWASVWKFLKKLKIELSYDPAIPLAGLYPIQMKAGLCRGICTPMFIVALFTIAKEGLMLKLKLQYFGHLMPRTDSFEKTLMLGQIEGWRRRGRQRMSVLDGISDSMDIFEETPGVGDGQSSLVCYSPWGHNESDTTEQLN